VMGDAEHVAADVLACHPSGIGGTDERASRCPGNDDRLDSQFVEGFEHGNMREAARSAGAKCAGDRFHRAPASKANDQALAGSGRTSSALDAACSLVAVPSRTRPTMPWRIAASRKKLYAR